MPENERFNLLLSPEQKQEWEEYAANNPNVDSLSHLVRLAVQKEIHGKDTASNGPSEELTEQVSELLGEIRNTNSQLQGLEARMNTIEQAVQQDPEITALANEVFAILPTKEQIEEYGAPEQPMPAQLPEEEGGPIAYSGRVADIAALADSSELRVQNAIDKLQENTGRVREMEGQSRVRYFKEV